MRGERGEICRLVCLIGLICLCRHDDIRYAACGEPVKHHVIVLGGAYLEVDELNYHIGLFLRYIGICQSRPFLLLLGTATRVAVAGEIDDIKFLIYLIEIHRYRLAGLRACAGEAFSAEEQVVLLIDEIDKADLEFPNDLLWELDRMEFYIPETKETVKAKQRPIVIITSNAEKELPDAFLRRCVFHYIEFPDQAQMEAILRVHFEDLDEQLLRQALAAFYWLRELRGIEKKPSTSELVDWIRALAAGGVDPSRIEDTIPYAGVLLKKDKDLHTLRKVK